jgi:DNA repair protein RecO (recombination protein O)
VSRQAGAPWHDKMLTLPAFLQRGSGLRADPAAVEDAFRLTGFFFARHVYEPRGIEPPDARAGFLAALRRHNTPAKAAETIAGGIDR